MKFYERNSCVKDLEKMMRYKDMEKIKGSKLSLEQKVDILGNKLERLGSGSEYSDTDIKRTVVQYRIEAGWEEKKRPYYCIWPRIQEAFLKSSLDLPGKLIHLPMRPLLIRFAEQEGPIVGDVALRSILVEQVDVRKEPGSSTHMKGLSVWIDVGEMTTVEQIGYETNVYTYAVFPLTDLSIEDQLLKMAEDSATQLPSPKFTLSSYLTKEETTVITASVKTVVSLCLLGTNNDLITPDVLNGDLLNYKKTLDDKYIDKAHRRGKVGWHVGRDIEVSPHFRRPHFGIRWTGEGRRIPRLVPIKGSVIHKDKIETVPTGYEQGEMQ